jgi:hypothetical protein
MTLVVFRAKGTHPGSVCLVRTGRAHSSASLIPGNYLFAGSAPAHCLAPYSSSARLRASSLGHRPCPLAFSTEVIKQGCPQA